jgi:hypothetical protein
MPRFITFDLSFGKPTGFRQENSTGRIKWRAKTHLNKEGRLNLMPKISGLTPPNKKFLAAVLLPFFPLAQSLNGKGKSTVLCVL